jgi:hypothetical protein
MSAPAIPPSQVSSYLNRISRNLKKPSSPLRNKARAKTTLRQAVSLLDGTASAGHLLHLALEEVELSLWDMEQGVALNTSIDWAHKQTIPDKLEPALKAITRRVNDFIKELTRGPEKKEDPFVKDLRGDKDEDVVTSAP